MAPADKIPPAHDSYDAFLQHALRRYWDRKGSSKVTFVALLLATKQAWSVAWDKGVSAESGKKALTGIGGAAAVAVALRILIGGPLGIVLAGASVASLLAVYGKNTASIGRKVVRFRGLVDEYEERYAELKQEVAGASESRRDLMIDGLMSRFLDELDTEPEAEAPEAAPTESGFAAHVARKEAEREPE
ncbi:MAG: hypothetical protein CMN30_10550 [Sandaracinus sp.]|nr:hypothetical protein [Sandaracinus sp.]|tara:strand:+ start:971 stop:1537 length:567 start_codon:yes stop_codon:yes gene_type:complete